MGTHVDPYSKMGEWGYVCGVAKISKCVNSDH